MITASTKDWFKNSFNQMAVVVYLLWGLVGQDKQTILTLLIYMLFGLVFKFSPVSSLIAAVIWAIPAGALFG